MRQDVLQISPWARAEQRVKIRAERRARLFGNVRLTFILLFFATILVFAFNRQVEVQQFVASKLGPVVNKLPGPDRFRAKALNYEKQVDQINQ